MQQISKELYLRASYVAPESYVVPILGGVFLMTSGEGDNEGWDKTDPYNW